MNWSADVYPKIPQRTEQDREPRDIEPKSVTEPLSFSSFPFLWPIVAFATASEAAASLLAYFAHLWISNAPPRISKRARWATENRVALDLQCMRLRDFSWSSNAVPTLVCAPFALHGANVADFAPGHSLVEALRNNGLPRIYVTDWRSATPDMRFLSIDNYLADLNIVVDEIGAPVDLIGLCQGGWMALVYAARFPHKVRRLVLAGAPIDIQAGESMPSQLAANFPLAAFNEIVRLGDGRVLGDRVLAFWSPALDTEVAADVLQIAPGVIATRRHALERRFDQWYFSTVDLPGTYYLQVVTWLFRENRIVAGNFEALGRPIDLASLRIPTFLLAARDDELVSANQLLATAGRIGTPRNNIEVAVEPCGHLSLFLGAATLSRTWPRIARWLLQEPSN
jgi:poly(3-hydroxyalkanoate) synthetase